jgi:hypothetical protein
LRLTAAACEPGGVAEAEVETAVTELLADLVSYAPPPAPVPRWLTRVEEFPLSQRRGGAEGTTSERRQSRARGSVPGESFVNVDARFPNASGWRLVLGAIESPRRTIPEARHEFPALPWHTPFLSEVTHDHWEVAFAWAANCRPRRSPARVDRFANTIRSASGPSDGDRGHRAYSETRPALPERPGRRDGWFTSRCLGIAAHMAARQRFSEGPKGFRLERHRRSSPRSPDHAG